MDAQSAPKSSLHQHQKTRDKTGQSEKPAIIVDKQNAAHAEGYPGTDPQPLAPHLQHPAVRSFQALSSFFSETEMVVLISGEKSEMRNSASIFL